jgi:hypothetical protein
MRALSSVLFALFPCALPARADIVLPGTEPVSHRLVIERSEAWDGAQRIVAAPVRGFGGTHVVEPGVPFSFSTKYGTRLYVVPPSEELPERIDESWSASHLSAAIPVSEVSSAPLASPLESLTTTLTVRALDRDRFELAVVAERSERDPWLLTGLATAFAAGVLGLVLIRRRRSRTSVS